MPSAAAGVALVDVIALGEAESLAIADALADDEAAGVAVVVDVVEL